MSLPVNQVADQITSALTSGNRLILSAPTGSGKSTQVPQILHHHAPDAKILVLQPRRIAARMLAERVAFETATRLGDQVGYLTRDERKMSANTKICFATTGVLLRMFQDDPGLSRWDYLVFDEFHERTIDSDLALGLCAALQKKRPDFKITVMSATLTLEALKAYLAPCEVMESGTRLHPVTTDFFHETDRPLWDLAKKALVEVLNQGESGDILMFMPGTYEIRKTIESCKKISSKEPLLFLPLHGNLSLDEQHQVMQPANKRKVIVATNIAETSLTIPGIRHVIDSGLEKHLIYDPSRGFNHLALERIGEQSAIQRQGRAGREAPGTCLRLWPRHLQLKPNQAPEIERLDLSQALLQIAALNQNPQTFPWFENPPTQRLAEGLQLLKDLQFLNEELKLTDDGLLAAMIPTAPRLARLILSAAEFGCLNQALICAALLSEKSPLKSGSHSLRKLAEHFDTGGNRPVRKKRPEPTVTKGSDDLESDLTPLLQALELTFSNFNDRGLFDQLHLNRSAVRQLFQTFQHLQKASRHLNSAPTHIEPNGLLHALMDAFPDHLACRKDRGNKLFVMQNGRHGQLTADTTIKSANLVLPLYIRQAGHDRKQFIELSILTAIRPEWLEARYPGAFQTKEEMSWNHEQMRVEKRIVNTCLGLPLENKLVKDDQFYRECGTFLADEILKRDLKLRGMDKEVESWIQRVRFLQSRFPERNFIAYDESDLACIIHEYCEGEYIYDKLKNKPLLPYIQNALSWDDQQFVNKMAPNRIKLPNGKNMKIRYEVGQRPKGVIRIQELFGLEKTPCVLDGREPILIEILAPNMRPVQITDDLASFWAELYPKIKPQLSRRYPRHQWL